MADATSTSSAREVAAALPSDTASEIATLMQAHCSGTHGDTVDKVQFPIIFDLIDTLIREPLQQF